MTFFKFYIQIIKPSVVYIVINFKVGNSSPTIYTLGYNTNPLIRNASFLHILNSYVSFVFLWTINFTPSLDINSAPLIRLLFIYL